jgi:hypothetical protein
MGEGIAAIAAKSALLHRYFFGVFAAKAHQP